MFRFIMKDSTLKRATEKEVLRKRAEIERKRLADEKRATKFIDKVIVRKFPSFFIDHVKRGTRVITLNIDSLIVGVKAIDNLAWDDEYNEIVLTRLSHRYPSLKFNRKDSKIYVDYKDIESGV